MQAPDVPENIQISFEKGLPVLVTAGDQSETDPLKIYKFLNLLAGKHGVGRLDIVESRFVGMKSRKC